jgi:hypothetical protein
MAENQTRPTDQQVADFLAAVPDERKRRDAHSLVELMRAVTGCEPQMWGASIVGFDKYHYHYESGREGDMPITGFSPRKQALTLYIMGGFENYATLLSSLGKHSTGKACLYVKTLDDVDMAALRALVEQSVAYMRAKTERPDKG